MIIGLYGALIGISIGMTLMAVIFYCTDADNGRKARVKELAKADRDGRVVLLPYKPETTDYEGLYDKYRVYRTEDNMPVNDCFVLRPTKDPAARIAMEAYAKATDNKELSEDILAAVGDSGRMVILPCKLGETVWVCQGGEVVGKTIGRITLDYYHDSNVEIDLCCDWDYPQRMVWHRDLNRYFWLTREAAEEALEAMKNAD